MDKLKSRGQSRNAANGAFLRESVSRQLFVLVPIKTEITELSSQSAQGINSYYYFLTISFGAALSGL